MSHAGGAQRVARHAPSFPDSRSTVPAARVLQSGGIRVDLDSGTVTVGGRLVRLARIEFQLLVLLIEAHGRELSHRDLVEAIRADGGSAPISPGLVHSQMRRLKEKLRAEGDRILDVETVDYVFGATSREAPAVSSSPTKDRF